MGVLLSIHSETVRKNINRYLSGSYAGLVQRDQRRQPTYLTALQAQSFKEVVLYRQPCEVG